MFSPLFTRYLGLSRHILYYRPIVMPNRVVKIHVFVLYLINCITHIDSCLMNDCSRLIHDKQTSILWWTGVHHLSMNDHSSSSWLFLVLKVFLSFYFMHGHSYLMNDHLWHIFRCWWITSSTHTHSSNIIQKIYMPWMGVRYGMNEHSQHIRISF